MKKEILKPPVKYHLSNLEIIEYIPLANLPLHNFLENNETYTVNKDK